MSSDSFETAPLDHSAVDFLITLEQSGVLSDSNVRAIRSGLGEDGVAIDSTMLAGQLVEQGTLTEFQASRLLVGKSRGLVLGRYILLDRIGIGAMGRVFKARHRLMDRVVALKIVLPNCVTSRNAVTRFFREMKIVGALDHPNVVRAFDADQHGDSPFIVMEYLEGQDLERLLRSRGPLPPDEVVGFMAQTAWGLAHAHEKGIIHRDVKPTNLFLTPATGIVKVLDLGLGAFVGVSHAKVTPLDTDEGFVVGTTDYMSPEQVSAEPIDARTDLFSLGCTMYRLLTNSFAFPGATKMDRLVRRIQGAHRPITELRGDLHPRLIKTLDRLLCLRPDGRFSEASEVAEVLESLLPASERPSHLTGRLSVSGASSRRSSESRCPETEPPVDWSLVESALRPAGRSSLESGWSQAGASDRGATVSPRKLDSHRRHLESEGTESGRSVQREYRKEVIRLNQEIAAQNGEEPDDESSSRFRSWLERAGERLGDFLSEPSAGHMIVIAVVTTLIVAIGLAVALG